MKKEPFQLSVNDQFTFSIQPDEAKSLDLIQEGTDLLLHVLENGQGYQVEVLDIDYANRTYTLRIDGAKYEVKISDYYERLVKELGFSRGGSHKINLVKAPMPGLVIKVLATPGQTVQKGDALLILEAMKMENVIKAIGDGTVKSINIQEGEPVDKGTVLLEFE
ncbi:MAG: biotin/lipoyl-binding protein [Bacteroidetes bacterium]|nr:MAG: biotin/lipoyl-binding protein [Bacteroidota bacterium]